MNQIPIQEDCNEIDAGNCDCAKQAMRILVVDDDKISLQLVSRILQNFGYEVITASDGTEAWNILQIEAISFVITDWMMPGIDGLEVCRRLRSNPSYTPILMLTSKTSELDRVLGLEIGADDYVTKPFSIKELLGRVKANRLPFPVSGQGLSTHILPP